MSSNKPFSYRLFVYVLVAAILLGSGFGIAAAAVGLGDWVSYLILGILAFLLLTLVLANEIYIHLSKRKKKEKR